MAFFTDGQPAAGNRRAATHLLFRVGGQLYGAPVRIVAEVAAADGLAPLAAADEAVVGELPLRGGALVVVDMGLRLQGRPVRRTDRCCVLVVRGARERCGCLVDEPHGLEALDAPTACLVSAAEGVAAIPPHEVTAPENASLSGEGYGLPLCRARGETVLLPPEAMFFPR